MIFVGVFEVYKVRRGTITAGNLASKILQNRKSGLTDVTYLDIFKLTLLISDKAKLPAKVGRKTMGLTETAGLPKYHNISGKPAFLVLMSRKGGSP